MATFWYEMLRLGVPSIYKLLCAMLRLAWQVRTWEIWFNLLALTELDMAQNAILSWNLVSLYERSLRDRHIRSITSYPLQID